jgi:glycosyltransferase involved in cell wall biosynthesis
MISIFIRTYRKDIHWLMYSLKSIHKNLKGWDEIVICIPTGQEHLLNHLTQEKVVVCKTYKDDYIGQQVSKLEAHKYCQGDYILFVDSDVMFYEGADVRDYFIDNKPIILKERYERVGAAICWKPIVEKLFKEPVEYEYMRFAPQIFHKSTLERFAEAFSDIENYAIQQPERQFSEFNILGFFVAKNEPENYSIIDLEFNPIPVNRSKQFWSWSGLTTKERIELDQL